MIEKGASTALKKAGEDEQAGDHPSVSAIGAKLAASLLQEKNEESKVKHLRLHAKMLKAHIYKRYDKALADKIIREIEVHAKNLFQIDIYQYITLLKDMLLAPCPVEKGLQVPNYLKFLFTLLD